MLSRFQALFTVTVKVLVFLTVLTISHLLLTRTLRRTDLTGTEVDMVQLLVL